MTETTNYTIGIQLYSLKDQIEKDVMRTLNDVKLIGYSAVEVTMPMLSKPKELKKRLKSIGLTAPSVHVPLHIYDNKKIEKQFHKDVELISDLGAKYAVIPWLPIRNQIKPYELSYLQDLLSKLYTTTEEYKLKLVLHNYSREFVQLEDGEYIIDQLLGQFDEGQIQLELDLGHLYLHGLDPFEIYTQYEQQTELIHIRTLHEGRMDGLLETGVIKYGEKLPSLANLDQKVIFVEQQHHKQKALEDAKLNYEYLQRILMNNNSKS